MTRHTDVPIFARRHAPRDASNHPSLRNRVVPAADTRTIGWVDSRGYIQFHKNHEDCVPRRGHEMIFLFLLAVFCVVMGLGLAWCIV